MSEVSRRNFLYAGGALAAGAAAMATPVGRVGAATRSETTAAGEEDLPAPEGDGQLVVYVSNTGAGEVTVLTEGHEVVFHDPKLVARVQRAAKRAEG